MRRSPSATAWGSAMSSSASRRRSRSHPGFSWRSTSTPTRLASGLSPTRQAALDEPSPYGAEPPAVVEAGGVVAQDHVLVALKHPVDGSGIGAVPHPLPQRV